MKSKPVTVILSVLFVIALAALIITAAIAIPIYFRPFYYWQIKPLGIVESASRYTPGVTYEEIKETFNLLMDYLTLPGTHEFPTEIFAYTQDEIDHFDDCRVLFLLDTGVAIVSAVIVTVIGILNGTKVIRLSRPRGHSLCTIAVLVSVLVPVAFVIIFAAVGWDEGFEIFHDIFFPGKSNWVFNPRTEQIINILPDDFFMNCAILIGVAVVLADAGLIIYDVIASRRRRRLGPPEPKEWGEEGSAL